MVCLLEEMTMMMVVVVGMVMVVGPVMLQRLWLLRSMLWAQLAAGMGAVNV